eukprot:18641-Heterococcus_DN1.PRE.2
MAYSAHGILGPLFAAYTWCVWGIAPSSSAKAKKIGRPTSAAQSLLLAGTACAVHAAMQCSMHCVVHNMMHIQQQISNGNTATVTRRRTFSNAPGVQAAAGETLVLLRSGIFNKSQLVE